MPDRFEAAKAAQTPVLVARQAKLLRVLRPINWVDPDGLTKGGKQNIEPSVGDPIGGKIRHMMDDPALSSADKNRLLKDLEKEISEVSSP
ncbi:MAG: hypothetical protein HYV63_22825 [Candidatus Schekmanbacteria bacterium]|nr:hypothetical protein [Candidatus Schekmanbacteria bacterium]